MTAIALAAAAVLIIGVTAVLCYLAGREHGHGVGYTDGFGAGLAQARFDAAMDAMHPDEERIAYQEAIADSEVTS